MLELILLVLKLEVLLLESLLLGCVRWLSSCQQVCSRLTTVWIAVDVVIVELMRCTFVEMGFISELGRSFSALNQIILQSLRVKRLIENVGNVHGPAELLLIWLLFSVVRCLRDLVLLMWWHFMHEVL